MNAAGGVEDRQLAARFVRIVDAGRRQRPWRGEFLQQQGDAAGLVERLIIGAGAGDGEQFGDGAGMDVRVLPQVERRQVEAEDGDGMAQAAQAATAEQAALVADQGTVQHVEVGGEFGGRGIGFGLGHGMARCFELVEAQGGGRQPRVEAGDGAAVRLVEPVRTAIGRLFRQAHQFHVGHRDQRSGGRQLGAELVQLLEQETDRLAALRTHRAVEYFGGDEGVAVAVAADPGAGMEEGRQLGRAALLPAGNDRRQMVFAGVVEPGQFAQEGRVIEGQRVIDFVHHRELGPSQHARLPQAQHGAAQGFGVLGLFLRRQIGAVALVEQARDLPLAIEDALALYFGRVRGQHRPHLGALEEIAQRAGIGTGTERPLHRQRQAALAWLRAGADVGARTADVVLVLGDVGQVRKVAEGPHHHVGPLARQLLQHGLHLLARGKVVVAMKAQRKAADLLDALEKFGAFLLAHGVAEQAAEQADVVAQRLILVGGGSGRGHVHGCFACCRRAWLSWIARSRWAA
jgi:hypothetical protein